MGIQKEDGRKISFFTNENEEVIFCVVEQTKLNGVEYLLVTEDMEDEAEEEAYILKDISAPEDEEAVYDMVEEENELKLIAAIFEELLDDTDIISD